jgi:peptide/nickel transport system substrate-binding protein
VRVPQGIRARFWWAAIVAGSVMIAGTSGFDSSWAQSSSGRSLQVAQDTAFAVLDPASAGFARAESEIVRHVYSNLVRYKFDERKIEPELATSWETSPDGRAWTFRLRRGVKFHDGTDFNAEAVKFTFDRLLDPRRQFASSGVFAFIDEVRVVDPYTVTINTKYPFGAVLTYLSHTGGGIVSPTAVRRWGDDFVVHPVGTGQYEATEVTRGSRVVLRKNPNYFGPAPKPDEIVWRTMVDDGARVAALESGQVDVATSIPAQDISRLKGRGFTVTTADSLQNQYLGINVARQGLSDVRVRRAINYAIDKRNIVNVLFQNLFTPLTSVLPQGAFGYGKQEPAYEHNPDEAKRLLQEAGYGPGRPLRRLVLWSPEGMWPKDIVVAQAIQGHLKRVGIEVDLQRQERGSYYTRMTRETDFDLFLFAFIGSTGDGYQTLVFTLGSQIGVLPGSLNFTRYKNPRFDDLVEGAAVATDQARRDYFIKQAQKVAWQDAPYAYLYNIGSIVGMRKGVSGVEVSPLRFAVMLSAAKD